MDDPILRAAVLFTRNHLSLIALCIVVATLGGLLYGALDVRPYRQRAVLISATTAKDGPIEDLGALAKRLEQMVSERAKAGTLSGNVELEARPIVGQPPAQEDTNLIELVAHGDTAEATQRTLDAAGTLVVNTHAPAVREERERLTNHAASLRSNLERLEKQRITPESSVVLMQLVRELIDTERLASPARVYEPGFLAVYRAEKQTVARGIALPGLLGFLGGVGGGYGAAFFVVAFRVLGRERRSKNGRAS